MTAARDAAPHDAPAAAPGRAPVLFVTGGAGYVGRALLRRLARPPARLAGARLPDAGAPPPRYTPDGAPRPRAALRLLLRPGEAAPSDLDATTVVGDLLEPRTYADALAGCDAVVHLAALTGKASRAAFLRVNATGTRALLAACREARVGRFLHVSTIAAVFADQRRAWYAQSKRLAEQMVAASGLRHAIVRPTIVLGRGAPVLAGLRAMAGAPVVPVFGDGRAPVQPVWVDDVARCLVSILCADAFDGRAVDCGGPDVLTIEELLLAVRRTCFGTRPRVVHLPHRPLAALLGALEHVAPGALPVTASQLAVFVNDGRARHAPWTPGPTDEPLRPMDQMLAQIAAGP